MLPEKGLSAGTGTHCLPPSFFFLPEFDVKRSLFFLNTKKERKDKEGVISNSKMYAKKLQNAVTEKRVLEIIQSNCLGLERPLPSPPHPPGHTSS